MKISLNARIPDGLKCAVLKKDILKTLLDDRKCWHCHHLP